MSKPEPHPFDLELYPYGKRAGDNKFDLTICPTCGRPSTHPTADEYPWSGQQIPAQGFFMFKDELSAKEYYISGMCQDCQDSVFNVGDDN